MGSCAATDRTFTQNRSLQNATNLILSPENVHDSVNPRGTSRGGAGVVLILSDDRPSVLNGFYCAFSSL